MPHWAFALVCICMYVLVHICIRKESKRGELSGRDVIWFSWNQKALDFSQQRDFLHIITIWFLVTRAGFLSLIIITHALITLFRLSISRLLIVPTIYVGMSALISDSYFRGRFEKSLLYRASIFCHPAAALILRICWEKKWNFQNLLLKLGVKFRTVLNNVRKYNVDAKKVCKFENYRLNWAVPLKIRDFQKKNGPKSRDWDCTVLGLCLEGPSKYIHTTNSRPSCTLPLTVCGRSLRRKLKLFLVSCIYRLIGGARVLILGERVYEHWWLIHTYIHRRKLAGPGPGPLSLSA
jgi:hypothetical protein